MMNKIIVLLVVVITVLLTFWSMKSVEVIDVHMSDAGYSNIVVSHLPYTDKSRIEWWLENQKGFEDKYKIPSPSKYGSYNIAVWGIGDGYINFERNYKKDLYCFGDMKADKNCIEKNLLLTIRKGVDGKTIFTIGINGETYVLNGDEIVKVQKNKNW
ncbi:DUF943 family protein [Erwiniaceae bacterium BAC15a-03b]|uniref:DUF943 family protein n=1 Tax=Winslowiella arboricola TaxID=2978220 RepID=A0A9J6PKM1_9GAMM|nr:DUF943 family protein [Winslowiella arboricola]MCU5773979.1 DUF943 family protein [Winslowiella arboricola]MCU5777294.1 DUF943 family protein [Winslowiella arboricola]